MTVVKGALVGGFAGAVGTFVGGLFNPLAGIAIYVGGAILLVALDKVVPG
jgi:hypothetical protein